MIDEFVLVRGTDSGVRSGTLKQVNGRAVLLHDARIIWEWTEAFTLFELSQNGGGESSRISEKVPQDLVLDAIEVILCSTKAKKNLSRSRNGS